MSKEALHTSFIKLCTVCRNLYNPGEKTKTELEEQRSRAI